jgi:hypothetical protein
VLHFTIRSDQRGYYISGIENMKQDDGESRRYYAKVKSNNECSLAAPW